MRRVTQGNQLALLQAIAAHQPVTRRKLVGLCGERTAHYLEGLWQQGFARRIKNAPKKGGALFVVTDKGFAELEKAK
jgi:chromosome segregation and condensation protein ScpB